MRRVRTESSRTTRGAMLEFAANGVRRSRPTHPVDSPQGVKGSVVLIGRSSPIWCHAPASPAKSPPGPTFAHATSRAGTCDFGRDTWGIATPDRFPWTAQRTLAPFLNKRDYRQGEQLAPPDAVLEGRKPLLLFRLSGVFLFPVRRTSVVSRCCSSYRHAKPALSENGPENSIRPSIRPDQPRQSLVPHAPAKPVPAPSNRMPPVRHPGTSADSAPVAESRGDDRSRQVPLLRPHTKPNSRNPSPPD